MGEFSVYHWLIAILLFVLVLVPNIFFMFSLQRAFVSIDDQYRSIAPSLVWLLLIPIFNFIWIFFLIVYLRDGYKKMWENNRLTKQTTAGFGVGVAYAVCWALCMVPGLNIVIWLPALVLWILYWVQVSQCRDIVKLV